MDRYRKGLWAEQFALIFLWLKGYRLLAKRYKTRFGEIDLIVRNQKRVLFVEVKARDTLVQGLEAISPKSQKRIVRAAEFYLQKKPNLGLLEARFDAIVIKPWSWPYHLKNAWDLS